MPARSRPPRLRLPAFVTAAAVEELLGWARSIRRQVCAAAADEPSAADALRAAEGDAYRLVLELLAQPGGGGVLQKLVETADPKNARGLPAALMRAAARELGQGRVPAFDPRAAARRLLEAGHDDRAAWFALVALAGFDGPEGGEAEPVTTLIQETPALRERLGDYLNDWSIGGGVVGGSSEALAPVAGDEPMSAWFAAAAAIRTALDADDAAMVGGLPDLLRSAADTLDELRVREAERSRDESARADAVRTLAAHLRELAKRWPAGPPWAAALSEAAVDPPASEQSRALLAEAVAWAESWLPMIEEAEAVWLAAHTALAEDDSDAGNLAFTAAAAGRRELRRDAEAAGSAFAARLIGLSVPQTVFDPPTPKIDHAEAKPHPVSVLEPAIPPEDDMDLTPALKSDAASGTSNEVVGDAAPPHSHGGARSSTEEPVSAPISIARLHDVADTAVEVIDAPPTSLEPQSPGAPHPAVANTPAAILSALSAGRYGLAAQIATAADSLGPSGACATTPFGGAAVLKALAVGEALNAERLGAVEVRFGETEAGVLAALEVAAPASPARLLTLAGALKPALFSAQTAAAEMIRAAELGRFGPALHDAGEFIADVLPKRGGALDIDAAAPAQAAGAGDLSERRAAILEMADGARFKHAVFHRATLIWRELFEAGPVADAVAALRKERPAALALVEAAAGWIDRDVDERVHQLDRDRRDGRDARLEARAREWLLSLLEELAGALRRWAVEARRTQGVGSSHSDETRRMLRDRLVAAAADLSTLNTDPALAAAAAVTSKVLAEVIARLDGAAPADDALTLDMRLTNELLLLDLPSAGRQASTWLEADATALLASAPHVVRSPPDYLAAFYRLVAGGRFLEAEDAVARLVADETATTDGLLQELEDAREVRLADLEHRVEVLRGQVDDLLGADAEGFVDPAASLKVDDVRGRLEAARADGETLKWLNFPQLEREVEELEHNRSTDSDLLLAPLERELAERAAAGADVAALRDLAVRGELTALREGLDSLRAGAELDTMRAPDKQLRDYAPFVASAHLQLPAPERNPAELQAAAAERRDTRLIRFSEMEEVDAEAARALLAAWTSLKKRGAESGEALRGLLETLGFVEVRVGAPRSVPGGRRFAVTTRPTSDRAERLVPAFGSAAKGTMEVLVVEPAGVRDGGELHKLVKGLERSSVTSTLVIFKGLMTAVMRKAFMVEARRRASQEICALMDEATLLFLASRSGRRLSDLFSAALPSGGVQPYSDDPMSKTPPEMFFGRAEELDKLWDRKGSCLVFGGRQLGKTALLEQVRMRHHQPKLQVVVYDSLQGDADLWPWVKRLLVGAGVAVKGTSKHDVRQSVRNWLAEDESRRIVILVDEADTYLEFEMNHGYESLIAVRDLMQETDRRCKFVFAGLHNVQRLARTPNSPLLHFGTPLRIGPLFGQDLGDAQEMVTLPMAAAGVVFDRPGLPLRVLSAVAYYPSLLQTFGVTLLNRVNRRAHALLAADSPLPIVIDEREVANTLDDPRFKDSVREKFNKTLDLDQRYRLITLAMVNRALERRETGGAPALTDVEIQSLARGWWPQAFLEVSSLQAFQGLLQEMVGLGVLIVVGDGRYAVRSAAIAAMLGGKAQIEQELIELSLTPVPEALDTGSLRRLEGAEKRPSPLTFRQEGVLLETGKAATSVHLALGSVALGQDALAASLTGLPQTDEFFVQALTYDTARGFGARLEQAEEAGRARRRDLLILTGPWLGRTMVDEALAAASRRGGGRRSLKVLLVPSSIDWDAADGVDDHGRLWGADVLSLATLGRSGLQQWLRARLVGDSSAAVQRLRELTGGYPRFLSGLRGAASDILADAEAAFAERMKDPTVFAQLGLSDARLRRAAEVVAEYETSDPDDLAGEGVANAESALAHLERLGVLERTGQADAQALQLNPFVAALLTPLR